MSRIDITSSGTPLSDGMLQTANPLDATLQVVTDNVGNSSTVSLSTTETQINSVLRIRTNNSELLDIENTSGNRFNINRDVQKINLDFSSNPTGSTDIVGAIRTFIDGVSLSDAMSFIEDGSIGIGTNAPLGLLHLKRTAATTRMVIDGNSGQSKIITYRTNGVQRFGLYTNNTAESGANVGSDFAIRAYSDAGTLLTTPLLIQRSTGNIGVNQTSPTAKLHIKGAGSTSATTSFKIVNSSNSEIIKTLDDGTFRMSTVFNTTGIIDIFSDASRGAIAMTNLANTLCLRKFVKVLGDNGGFSNNDVSAAFQIDGTNRGFLPPRVTSVEKNAIATPAAGLVVYDTTLNKLCVRTAAAWETITSI